MSKIARIKSAHLQTNHHSLASHVQHVPDMPYTANTSESDTDTQLPPDAAVSSFSSSRFG